MGIRSEGWKSQWTMDKRLGLGLVGFVFFATVLYQVVTDTDHEAGEFEELAHDFYHSSNGNVDSLPVDKKQMADVIAVMKKLKISADAAALNATKAIAANATAMGYPPERQVPPPPPGGSAPQAWF